MGRAAKTEPAICPVCKFDFIGSGVNRYMHLKRHIKSQHKESPIGNTYNHCNINNTFNIVIINGQLDSESVKKLLTPSVIAKLERIMSTNDGSLVVPLFDALHCNPNYPETHKAVIPNINKDCMLVMTKEGNTESKTKVEGAKMIIDSMFESDIPTVSDHLEDGAFDSSTKLEEQNKGDIVPELITHLETLPKGERMKMSRSLKEKVHA
jgi:hypothetical protein